MAAAGGRKSDRSVVKAGRNQNRSDRYVGMVDIGKCANYNGDGQQETTSEKDILLGAVQFVAPGGSAPAGSRITAGKRP